MNSDRELLEKAAKAAGFEFNRLYFDAQTGLLVWEPPKNYESRDWNPLTDDGDALRLAVKLRIKVKYHDALGQALVWFGAPNQELTENIEDCKRDEAAVTRRAIVRAAAALGDAS